MPPRKTCECSLTSTVAADWRLTLPRQCKKESLQLPTVINEQRGCRTTTRRLQFAQHRFSSLASWRKLPVDQIERAPASPDPIVLLQRHASLPLAQPPKVQLAFRNPRSGVFMCNRGWPAATAAAVFLPPHRVCEWAVCTSSHCCKSARNLAFALWLGCDSISLAMSLMASHSMRVFCDN